MFDPTRQTRKDFPYLIQIPTRWSDNDMLGHVNNVLYYRYFEAIVVRFLMEEAGIDWINDAVSPQAVETLCRFHRPLSFPETFDVSSPKIEKSQYRHSSCGFIQTDEYS